jgi:predicted MFS family arabinose efflux permease
MVGTFDRPAEVTWPQLLIMLLGRFLFNTAFRMIYPLLALLASGLQVDIRTASLLVTVQVGATLISPLGGALADRWGERRTMLAGLALFCLGCGVGAFATSFWPFLLGNLLIGIGSSLYNPAIQAYASARSSYARRGRVLGALELSWAGSALIGVAALAWLIDRAGSWTVAYLILAALGGLMLLLTLALPPDGPGTGPQIIDLRKAKGQPRQRLDRATLRQVVAVLSFGFLALIGVETILIVYASWLQADFSATTQQLGLVYGLIGIIEIFGSGGSALFVDRIGKLRAVLASFGAAALLALLLPLSGGQWLPFLVLFLGFHLFFEFGIVSLFPLVSELAPAARGTVIALSIAAIGLGRMVGSLVGPLLLERIGFLANGLASALLILVALAIFAAFVRERAQG